MKIAAITLWQPWASLVAAGVKPYEFRKWYAHRHHHNTRVAIHAGIRFVDREEALELGDRLASGDWRMTGLVEREKAIQIIETFVNQPETVPYSQVLCTAVLHAPVSTAALLVMDPRFTLADQTRARNVNDSDRLEHSAWAWPLTDIRPVEPPFPVRGAQGFWTVDLPDSHFTDEELA